MNNLKECKQKRTDCLMNDNGKCVGLNNTEFNKKCPFYKLKEINTDRKD